MDIVGNVYLNQNKMKKQTAVECFYQKLIDSGIYLMSEELEFYEQAKAMEKEQHQETFKQARLAKIFEKDMPPVWESWEQYYNETFKSE